MTAILLLKLGQITIRLTFLISDKGDIRPFLIGKSHLKCNMTAILLSKLGQITIRLTFLAVYLLHKFDKPNCSISSLRAS